MERLVNEQTPNRRLRLAVWSLVFGQNGVHQPVKRSGVDKTTLA